VTSFNRWNIHLTRERLGGRSFLLGNKRALSLSLPAGNGPSDPALHLHKWYGVYQYGRKFLEGQILRANGLHQYVLGLRQQTGMTQTLTGARREYQVEGIPCSEEFFVPDGLQALACVLDGEIELTLEPEFDLRFYRSLNTDLANYELEIFERGVLVSSILPSGEYDDLTETFLSDGSTVDETRMYAAAEIVGDDVSLEVLPSRQHARKKFFRKDQQRHRFVSTSAPEEAMYDHAPLWDRSTSVVFAPVRFHTRGHGTVIYGFGSTAEEAFEQLATLRDNLVGYQVQKTETMNEIMAHASFESHLPDVDTAYTQVLGRLMDALVARHVVAEDTVLDHPATMILAGNQYFHDSWKRDENIALGFLLALGFYDLARDVIHDTWQLQDPVTGRLPQRIRAGEAPPYHSSDGTLWALIRLYHYWRCTGDESLLFQKLPMVELFFRRSLERAVEGMLPSGRTTAPEYLWETWMDTPHTPRHGFPIEIQMLWIACLRNFRPLLRPVDPILEEQMALAEAAAWQAIGVRFQVRGLPADSLDEQGVVRDLITPNPFFCFGVGLDLGPEVERTMREVGRRQLAGRQGIRTLAPEDWSRVFTPEFLGDRRNVRGRRMRSIGKFNYHRGVEWNWLAQFFVQAELKYGEPDVAFRKYLRPQVQAVLHTAGIGGISELFDFSGTRGPEFQAWSMAGFLEAIHAFAGVHIDVPQRRIALEPQLPDSWPRIDVRKWYGNGAPFDLHFSSDHRSRTLRLEFPWGEVPDAELEIALTLPARHTADFLDVRLDGTKAIAKEWVVEPLLGTDKARARFTLPARGRVEVVLGLKRAVVKRVALTA
jgi:hypothetical protein